MARFLLFTLMLVQAASGCNVIDPRPMPGRVALRPDGESVTTPRAKQVAVVTPTARSVPAPAAPTAPPPPPPAPAPPPNPYTLYGVAWQMIAVVRAAPERDAPQMGYLRRGAQFRAKARVSKQGCSRGWHEINGGGFVCDGDGVRISSTPVSFEPAPAPAERFEPMPYEYVMVSREDTPEYFRVPTVDEEAAVESLLYGSRGEPEQRPQRSVPRGVGSNTSAGTRTEPEDGTALTGAEAEARDEGASNIPPPSDLPPLLSEGEGSSDAAPEPTARTADGRALPEYVSARLTKGFYLSIDGRVHAPGGRRFLRTVRGRFVSAARVWHTTPSDFRGTVLDESMLFPIAFMKKTVQALRWNQDTSRLVPARLVPRLAAFHIRDVAHYRGSEYLRINGDRLVRPEWVVRVDRAEPPHGVEPDEKWIDVDLAHQTLTAYEGDRPVFVTLISTGRATFDTPPGTFRIQSKHVTTTMDDATNPDGAYSIEDVPWTMYFREGLALHAAFWHDRYGERRSHGCVNLSPADAHFLFDWTFPEVPVGWHGTFASRERPGTRVVIH